MTLKEQAWQSDLVLLEETSEWNEDDWPLLEGGWRSFHASVVLDHPNSNNNGQTVVVLGGCQEFQGAVNSVFLLNLAEPNKQWRQGPPMNKKRDAHAAVVCNGGIYVMGGQNGEYLALDCMERIDAIDLLESSLTNRSTHESNWATLSCRLSAGRAGCCAAAVHNRYIVVMGGSNRAYLSSVDIIDTRNHTVIEGPFMNVPRSCCASAVVGQRIFAVGGENDYNAFDSVEYLEIAKPHDKVDTASTVISSSFSWTMYSDSLLSNPRDACTAGAVGSCLVVVGERIPTVQVLDTHRYREWNLPSLPEERVRCSLVTVANQIAVISGLRNSSCLTLPLMDKHTWIFCRLVEKFPHGWHHCVADGTPST